MGPQIILDKSSLQSLSADELDFLSKHYYVNVPPILLIEILADMKKYPEDRAKSEAEVATLARKLRPGDSKVNIHYKFLATGSLLGYPLPMNGRPVIPGGQEFTDSRGDKGLLVEEQPEEKVLRKWRQGAFSGTEELLAEQWRESVRAVDLGSLKNQLRGIYEPSFQPDTIGELVVKAHEILSDPGKQTENFWWILSELQLDGDAEQTIQKRWQYHCWPTTLEEFSPYVFYIAKAILTFYLGLVHGLVGTRSTNRIDLEYLFYLPFCLIFSSRDALQGKLAQALLDGRRQDYVDGQALKKDLKRIADWWSTLTEEEKQENAYDYGHYPPNLEGSFTAYVWQKHMRPWSPGSGNRVIKMTKEGKERLMEELRPVEEAIRKLKSNDG